MANNKKTARLVAPNGAKVEVDAEKVENLLRLGFTKPSRASAKADADSDQQ